LLKKKQELLGFQMILIWDFNNMNWSVLRIYKLPGYA